MTDWESIGWTASLIGITILSIIGLAFSAIAGAEGILLYLFGFFFGSVFTWVAFIFYLHTRKSSGVEHSDEPATTNSDADPFEFGDERESSNSPDPSGDDQPAAESPGKSRLVAVVETITAAGFGVIPVLILAHQEVAFPALALGAGAIVVALILLLVNGRTYYAGGGAMFCLLTATTIQLGVFPEGYAKSPFAVLVTLGMLSGLIVSIHLGIGVVLQRRLAGVTGERTALRIYDAVAAILGLIGIIWAVMNIHERAARYGGVTIGGTAGFVLNFLGIELPIPWIIADGVDATLLLYVGGILIGFHTLESLHTTWRATKATAKAGVGVGKKAGQKATATAANVREQYRE